MPGTTHPRVKRLRALYLKLDELDDSRTRFLAANKDAKAATREEIAELWADVCDTSEKEHKTPELFPITQGGRLIGHARQPKI